LDQMLLQGEDSLLHQELVKKRGMTDAVGGGINLLGNMYNYEGPMLWMASLIHDSGTTPEQIVGALDEVVGRVQQQPVTRQMIDRALLKVRSDLYDTIESPAGVLVGFGRADLLASYALFDDDPTRINTIEAEYRKLTPAIIQRTAREYLRPTNRTVLVVEPKRVAE
ncbi:MAG: M16 family metallopeptidase, partial [Pyrinomonadaceae bacterium]